MNTRHDYATLEREYVQGDMSLRELARTHGIANHSVITSQARRREWVRKREEYRVRSANKAVALMADDEGRRVAQEARVRDNAIEAIDEAISKMRSDMQRTRKRLVDGQWLVEPAMIIRPQDIAILIDRLNVLFGRPSNITEDRSLGISLSAGVEPEFLRSIVEATRGLKPLTGGAASSPLPRSDRTREN